MVSANEYSAGAEQPDTMLILPSVSDDHHTLAAGQLTRDGTITAVISTDGGTTWSSVTDEGPPGRLVATAISPAGDLVAIATDNRLAVKDTRDRRLVLEMEPMISGGHFDYVAWAEGVPGVLVVSIQEPVEGANPEFASLSNLWVVDVEGRRAQRATSLGASATSWSLAQAPVTIGKGQVLYTVRQGDDESPEPPANHLWVLRVDKDLSVVNELVREIPQQALLAGVSDGILYWNVPEYFGLWMVASEMDAGTLSAVGCGASKTRPISSIEWIDS